MQEHQNLPDVNRLSVLMGIILLAYALTAFVSIPSFDMSFDIAGIVFEYALNLKVLVSILVSILAAMGTDWLLRGHPEAKEQNLFPHLILPALTAWMIGVPLNQLQVGVQWWIILGLASVLLTLVFVAEYIVVDLNDTYHAPATVGVTAISFALYLYLAIAIRSANLRLYLMIPALVFPLALLCLRMFYIRLGGKIQIAWSLVIAFLIGQIALGLHYFPISPLTFGLIVLAPAYALTSLASALEENRPLNTSWIEPAIMLVILWGLLLLIR